MVSPNLHSPERPDLAERGRRSIWQWLVEPSDAIEEGGARRQARLLSSLLVVLVPLTLIGTLWSILLGPDGGGGGLVSQGFAAVALIIAYGLSRTRHYNLAAALSLGALSAVPFIAVIFQDVYSPESLTNSFIWMALPILLGSVFLSLRGTAILAAANFLGLLLVPLCIPEASFGDTADLLGFAAAISGLLLLAIRNRDVLERTRQAELIESNRELMATRASLEERVTTRTQDLERRARYLEAAAAVAGDVAAMLDPQGLLSQVVMLISEQLGFYQTSIFLLDPTGEWAVLRATSSEESQQLLARGYRLHVRPDSIVGYVAGRGEPRIAHAVGIDAASFSSLDLPSTRSEAALPLRARGEIIGVLDVESTEPQAFSEEDVALLQTLADQVAVALSNARLFRQAEEALEAERRAYGEISRAGWVEALRAQAGLGYYCDASGIRPITEHVEVEGDGGLPEVSLPVTARGQVIGTIKAHKPAGADTWTEEEVVLMQTLADQLSTALESARLYQDTQNRAIRERLTSEITDKMRRAADIDTLMRTTIREMAAALGASSAFVQLGVPLVSIGDEGEGDEWADDLVSGLSEE
jgi:GAF domain-containing protein/multisubunit Na+/H+ antiporter MnhB subunit